MVGADSRHARRGKQQGIFDSRSQPPPALPLKEPYEMPFLLVGGRRQETGKCRAQVFAVERPHIRRIVVTGDDGRIERAPPKDGVGPVENWNMHHRRRSFEGKTDDFAGSSSPSRRKPVPHRDQHVAMRHGGASGHDIGSELVPFVSAELEDAGSPGEQRVEIRARLVVRKIGARPFP